MPRAGIRSAVRAPLLVVACMVSLAVMSPDILLPASGTRAVEDTYEPDDTVISAEAIAFGETQTRSIHAAGDQDWVKFTLSEPGGVRLLVELPTTSRAYVRLYLTPNESSGSYTYGYSSNRGFAVVERQLANTGTYYFRVYESGNNDAIDEYKLTLSVIAGDEYEPDDTANNAKSIALGQTQTRSIHAPDDTDWAKFTLSQPGGVRILVELPTTSRAYVRLYLTPNASSGSYTYGYSSDRGFAVVERQLTNTGTYFFRVYESGNNDAIPEYKLTVTSLSGEPPAGGDIYEPDDTPPTQDTISHGQQQARSIHTAGDVDWARFTLTATSAVTIATSGPSDSDGDTEMWLYGPNSSTTLGPEPNHGDDEDGFWAVIEHTAADPLAPGTYYVKVADFDNDDAISSYTLSLTVTPAGQPDSYEPDNSPPSQDTISTGQSQQRSIHSASDVDWARFTLSEPSTVVIDTGGSGSESDTEMWLYGPDSATTPAPEPNYSDDDHDFWARIEHGTTAPLAPGTYYIKVQSYANTEPIGSYTLSLTVTPFVQVAARSLPGSYSPGQPVAVSIAVTPPSSATNYAVEETPPTGWTISDIDNGGQFDAQNGKVKWGPFFDAQARTLTYSATPPAGTTGVQVFGGVVSADGDVQLIGGETEVNPNIAHPADTDDDMRLSIGEVTAYGAAWKKGDVWSRPPDPIGIAYVTNAGFLWKSGEEYQYDESKTPPFVPKTPPFVPTAARAPKLDPDSETTRQAAGTAVCTLTPGGYKPSEPVSVSIEVRPSDTTQVYAVEDAPPTGWVVSAISDNGSFDATNGKVKWGPFFDNQTRTLTYTATPGAEETGTKEFAGTASFDGANEAISGARSMDLQTNQPPGIADLVSPADGAVVSASPSFTAKAADPEGQQVKLSLELKQGDTVKTFETVLVDSGAEATLTLTPEEALVPGEWIWRARAVDTEGGTGEWSGTRTFTVNRAPGIPELLNPAEGSVVSPSPLLSIKVVDPDGDQVKLAIEVKLGDVVKVFETPLADSNSEAALPIPGDQALAAGQWLWRAKATDARGSEGEWSATRTLVVPSVPPDITGTAGLSTFGLAAGSSGATPASLGLGGAHIAIWDPAAQRYLVDAEVQSLEPGMGCWVKADTPVNLRFSGQPIAEAFPVSLKAGWNLISAPFASPVSWDLQAVKVRRGQEEKTLADAQSEGWIRDYAIGWQKDDANPTAGGYTVIYDGAVLPGVASALQPWRAYWVKAMVECTLILPASVPRVARVRRAAARPRGWSVRLCARSSRGSDQVSLGVAGGRGLAVGVPPDPPGSAGRAVRAALMTPDGPQSMDVRPGTSGRQEWELVIGGSTGPAGSPVRGEEITVVWPDLRALPRDVSLTLVDAATGVRRSLRTTSGYTFRLGSGARRLRIVADRRANVAPMITALRIVPLRSNTRAVHYTLSASATVNLHVISLDGRTVSTIAHARSATPGINQSTWSAVLAPGVYILRTCVERWGAVGTTLVWHASDIPAT